MKLFNFTLPKENVCQEQELYYRITTYGEGVSRTVNGLRIKKGGAVSFDTYFNCFSYAKYLRYTQVKKLTVVLKLKGVTNISLSAVRQQDGLVSHEKLKECRINTNDTEEIRLSHDFTEDEGEGYYYIQIAALSDELIFAGGYYDAEIPQTNRVKIAVVICTYKREEYIYRNMEMVQREIFNAANINSVSDLLKFFIVDNGKTLPLDHWDKEHIRVFPNKNYGGSGGFTRGIIEAYRRKDEFTHVLLMDDDIVFDPEVLVKTIRFLQVCKPGHSDLCIGGSMLRLDLPFLQHECGAFWQGFYVIPGKHDMDMRQWDFLLENELEEKVDYQGWWYMCMPLAVVNKYKLPLPLFINSDDVEYSLRAVDKLLLINGIGIWHPEFSMKYGAMPIMTYYIMRNHWVVNVLYRSKLGPFKHYIQLVLFLRRQILIQRYITAEFALRAYDDFLQGIDFFLNTDEEALHKELLRNSIKFYNDEQLREQGVILDRKKNLRSLRQKSSRWAVIKTIFETYFMPRCFYKNKDYGVVDILAFKSVNFRGTGRVLHYNFKDRKGFITEISKRSVWRLSIRLLFMFFKIIRYYPAAARSFRERQGEITNFDFWCRHLGIEPLKTQEEVTA
jgi:GT2 family glycosyltransferase